MRKSIFRRCAIGAVGLLAAASFNWVAAPSASANTYCIGSSYVWSGNLIKSGRQLLCIGYGINSHNVAGEVENFLPTGFTGSHILVQVYETKGGRLMGSWDSPKANLGPTSYQIETSPLFISGYDQYLCSTWYLGSTNEGKYCAYL